MYTSISTEKNRDYWLTKMKREKHDFMNVNSEIVRLQIVNTANTLTQITAGRNRPKSGYLPGEIFASGIRVWSVDERQRDPTPGLGSSLEPRDKVPGTSPAAAVIPRSAADSRRE